MKYRRWALLKRPESLSVQQRDTLALTRRHNTRLWRGYEIKEMVRAVYERPDDAAAWLDGAIRPATRSKLRPFQILVAVEHRLSNSPLEALNSRLALLNHRAAGFHSAAAFIALAMLCVGGFKPPLPHL